MKHKIEYTFYDRKQSKIVSYRQDNMHECHGKHNSTIKQYMLHKFTDMVPWKFYMTQSFRAKRKNDAYLLKNKTFTSGVWK